MQPDLSMLIPLVCAIALIAVLYSSVGHGGASGYIAVMALFALPVAMIKPTALLLNILVSSIAVYTYSRSGHFRWQLFWPFAASSIPCSFIGGALQLPLPYYKAIVGLVLLYSAYRLFRHGSEVIEQKAAPSLIVSMLLGGVLGILSGLTGVGGGIFLSPLILLFGWANPRETSGVSALFILVNSVAGILGHLSALQHIPNFAPWMGGAALLGGSVGSYLGSKRLQPAVVLKTLAAVLAIAGIKLLMV